MNLYLIIALASQLRPSYADLVETKVGSIFSFIAARSIGNHLYSVLTQTSSYVDASLPPIQ